MSQYKLNIKFSKDDMIKMKGLGEKITIVKESDDTNHVLAANSSSDEYEAVTWVAFNPFLTSTVTWDEQYSVYASDTEIQNGATIEKMSEEDAVAGFKKYVFSDGIFEGENYTGEYKTAYYISNQYTDLDKLTFGLAQSVKVTGSTEAVSNPINAMPVMKGHDAYFIPIVKLTVFLSSSAENGKVISVTRSQTLTVDFTTTTERTIQYNYDAGSFELVE